MSEIQTENSAKQAKIRPNQRKAVEAFISGATIQEAALIARVTERTIYLWRTQESFKQALQEAQENALSDSVIALSGATTEAVQVLRTIANDGTAPPATRVAAAKAIIESAIRMRELLSLEQRVAALEKVRAA